MFTPELMLGLARSAQRMRRGALLVTARRPALPGPGFRLLSRFVGPSSWSENATWSVHMVEGDMASTARRGAGTRHAGHEWLLLNATQPKQMEKCELAG